MSEELSTSTFEVVAGLVTLSAFVVFAPAILACMVVWWSRWYLFRLDRSTGEAPLDRRIVYLIVPLIGVTIGVLLAVASHIMAGSGDISTLLWLLIVAWCIQVTGSAATSRPAHRRLQHHRRCIRSIESRDLSQLDSPTVLTTTAYLARLRSIGERLQTRASSLTLTRFLTDRPRRSSIIAAVTLFSLAIFLYRMTDGTLIEVLESIVVIGSLPDIEDLAALAAPWLGPIYLFLRWHIDYFFKAQSGRDLARQATELHRRYRGALKLRQEARPRLSAWSSAGDQPWAAVTVRFVRRLATRRTRNSSAPDARTSRRVHRHLAAPALPGSTRPEPPYPASG